MKYIYGDTYWHGAAEQFQDLKISPSILWSLYDLPQGGNLLLQV